MDDDEDIHSHSTGSPPLSSSPPNGRVAVTVAAAAAGPAQSLPTSPLQQQQQSEPLAVALPIQQQSKANGGGGGREDCWSEGATGVLIDAWGERYLELSRGNLKQKHWKEVADIVSSREDYMKVPKTDIQCKNRIDTVKKKYKLEKAKIAGGNGPSKWPFYERLDRLIGSTAKIPPVTANPNKVPVGIPVRLRSGNEGGGGGGSGSGLNNISYGKSNQGMKNQSARKRGQVVLESTSEEEDEEELEGYSDDSLPPPREKRQRVGVQRGGNVKGEGKERKEWGNSVRLLTQAILKFGETYEQAESAKLVQVVEMEKTRMKFAKELELQRMQFFMKTQMEISQLKHGRRGGNASNLHTGNNVINNNSDSDN